MGPKHKSSAYGYFTVNSDLKYFVCQCIISEDGEERVMKKLVLPLVLLLKPMLLHVLLT